MKHNINFFNLHLQGGSKMIAQAVKTSKDTAKSLNTEPPTILGVSLLSSFGQRTLTEELGICSNIGDYSLKLAQIAKENGLDGVVATAEDSIKIREVLGEDFIIVCPAVRPTWSIVDDQVRVVTPADAIKSKIDYMVVGRPIRNAEDKTSAAQLIINEIDEVII
jgi:orotidine-5'-phosphate decarboxylase